MRRNAKRNSSSSCRQMRKRRPRRKRADVAAISMTAQPVQSAQPAALPQPAEPPRTAHPADLSVAEASLLGSKPNAAVSYNEQPGSEAATNDMAAAAAAAAAADDDDDDETPAALDVHTAASADLLEDGCQICSPASAACVPQMPAEVNSILVTF